MKLLKVKVFSKRKDFLHIVWYITIKHVTKQKRLSSYCLLFGDGIILMLPDVGNCLQNTLL